MGGLLFPSWGYNKSVKQIIPQKGMIFMSQALQKLADNTKLHIEQQEAELVRLKDEFAQLIKRFSDSPRDPKEYFLVSDYSRFAEALTDIADQMKYAYSQLIWERQKLKDLERALQNN